MIIQILWRIGGIPEHIHTLPGLRSSYWFHSVSPVKKKNKKQKQAFLMVLAGGAFRLQRVMMT